MTRQLLPTDLQTADCPSGSDKLPQLSVSASKDKAGRIHVTLCNLDPNAPAKVACQLEGAEAQKLSGRVLTAATMNAHNTFESPDNVKPAEFNACKPHRRRLHRHPARQVGRGVEGGVRRAAGPDTKRFGLAVLRSRRRLGGSRETHRILPTKSGSRLVQG